MVGQRFVLMLENHPWFRVVALTGSDRSIGKTVRGMLPLGAGRSDAGICPGDDGAADRAGRRSVVAFSALPADLAREAEPLYARAGKGVCSNASAFRQEPDVPILIPEVNPDHTASSRAAKAPRLEGLHRHQSQLHQHRLDDGLPADAGCFGIRRAIVVSMQAVSGAGYPGVASLDILDNVIPHIGGKEEEKVEKRAAQDAGNIGRRAKSNRRHSQFRPIPTGWRFPTDTWFASVRSWDGGQTRRSPRRYGRVRRPRMPRIAKLSR